MGYLNWIQRRIESPSAVRWIIGLAFILALPALVSPLAADDYIQQGLLEGSESFSGLEGDPLSNYFVFVSGDPDTRHRLMEDGIMPWWTAPEFRLAFARPISALTHIVDHFLWPGNGPLIHLHSLGWFALLLFALWRLFNRIHGPRLAALALLIYAVDDARGMVLSFAANRNALIAAFFGVCTLLAYDRWRRDGWRLGAALGPVLLAMALLAGESAIATTAFLFGYAVVLDRGRWWARLMRLAPYAAVVVAWQVGYSALGYGATASGVYVHPLHEPLAFLAKLLERAPILALGQLAVPPSDLWFIVPLGAKLVIYALAIGVIVVAWQQGRRLVRAQPELAFWLIGATVSLVPISATFASDRLLVFVGMGTAVALAAFFTHALREQPAPGDRRLLLKTLVAVHLVLAPLLLPVRSLTTLPLAHGVEAIDASIPREPAIADERLVVVYARLEAPFCYQRWERRLMQIPQPRKLRLLATGLGPASITRLDARTLRIRPDAGFYPLEAHQMVRGPQSPLAKGDTITLSDLTITITAVTAEGRAHAVDFRFASPLESSAMRWMRGEGEGLVAWSPPPVGETVILHTTLF